MFLHISEAHVISGWTLELLFSNGERRVVNLKESLEGPVFEPLRNPGRFAAVYVNHETGTIEWPNGADFAPEFLYEMSRPADSHAPAVETAGF